MSELDAIRKALQDAGVYVRVEQLAAKVAALPGGLERLLVSIASYRTDPNVRSVGGIVARAIEQGKLADVSNPKLLHAVQQRQDVKALTEDERLAMYPGYAATKRAEQEQPNQDPVGTAYYLASEALRGVTDPEPWARRTATGVEVLRGPREKQEEEEEEVKGVPPYKYKHHYPLQLRREAIARHLQETT
jgi:hypothetical protein